MSHDRLDEFLLGDFAVTVDVHFPESAGAQVFALGLLSAVLGQEKVIYVFDELAHLLWRDEAVTISVETKGHERLSVCGITP